jgi:hypothetical protein
MNQSLESKNKFWKNLTKAPVWLFLIVTILALGILGVMIAKMIKDDDTQGVYYGGTPEGYRKRMAEQMGGGGGGKGYGQGKPGGNPQTGGSGRR